MKKIYKYGSGLVFLLLLLTPLFVNAIDSGDDVIAVLSNILTWLWRMFAIITVIIFLIIGFFYLTSQGNPEKVNRANKWLLYGIIGLAVALLSGGMVAFVQSILESS